MTGERRRTAQHTAEPRVARRPGRRPGRSGTREAILAAARSRFAELGYEGATIRAIAAEAGVDPALVHHYFGTKEQLFAAAVQLPFAPGEVLAGPLGGEPERMGEAIVRAALAAWEEPATQQAAMGLLRAAASNERAAAMLRSYVEARIIGPISRRIATPDAPLRAALAASQVVGLALARYLVRVEPLASADPEDLVRRVGPTIQRYLTG